MFTGIIETQAELTAITSEQTNLRFTFKAPFVSELRVDQSIAHNGVCLTVVRLTPEENTYEVVAIHETLALSNLSTLQIGDFVNLERCLKAGDRIDGHIVQGHVDVVASCIAIEDLEGSWKFSFQLPPKATGHLIKKGSIAINGVSLTLVDVNEIEDTFSVAVIPYTFNHTHFSNLKPSQKVNIEFDMFGKYVQKHLTTYGGKA